MPTLQYARGDYIGNSAAYDSDQMQEIDSRRVTVYPDKSDYTVEVVITTVIEFESLRKEKEDGAGFSDDEKREYRERPDIRERAKQWVDAATASMAGSSAGQAIADLLGGIG